MELLLKNMRPGEKIEMTIRRHWIVYVLLGVYFFIGLVISLFFLLINVWGIGELLFVLFWMFFLVFLYIEWLNHELDMFIITNNRIIGVEQVAFLNRTVAECNLWQVQEVNSTAKGFFSNILNYGTIHIFTAGSSEKTFIMAFAPNALHNSRKVLNIVDGYRDKKHPTDEKK